MKYTESGFIKIISTLKDEHIEIDINDTGIGMTDKQLSELYQPQGGSILCAFYNPKNTCAR
ncbi:hypothetical protein ACPV4Z_18955 [Vibrio aestuarianus]|uniref:hypothetical protein n=1 Tax=Vibrio aestuarianus TaxID=28171 RepID=UPI004067FA73